MVDIRRFILETLATYILFWICVDILLAVRFLVSFFVDFIEFEFAWNVLPPVLVFVGVGVGAELAVKGTKLGE